MTLVCVPIFVEDADAALRDAALALGRAADLVEFRFDPLLEEGADADLAEAHALRALRECPLPVLATCRAADEGGRAEASDEARLGLLRSLVSSDAPPRYVDVEHETTLRAPAEFRALLKAIGEAGHTTLILSHHDLDGRPLNLLRRIAGMRAVEGAGALKIVWRARSVRDNLEALDVLRDADRPTIVLLMGASGLPSRVLAPKARGMLTFASLRPHGATAPGQPTIDDLLDLYRFRAVGHATRTLGVVGWPVEHSLSPLVHNAAFHAPGLERDAVYLPLPVAPGWEPFKATVLEMVHHDALALAGLSVTIPHKENLARLAREQGWACDGLTRDCSAANTLVVAPEGVRVHNTDARAIRDALASRLPDLSRARVAVLGAGGVARSAVSALCREGASVTVWNRTAERAERLARDVCDAVGAGARIEPGAIEQALRGADAIINCTPLGMASGPDPAGSPVGDSALASLPPETIVLDTVYTPLETPLLRAARDDGHPIIDGAEIFVRQAELQAELFNGVRPPAGLFDRLTRRELARRAAASE